MFRKKKKNERLSINFYTPHTMHVVGICKSYKYSVMVTRRCECIEEQNIVWYIRNFRLLIIITIILLLYTVNLALFPTTTQFLAVARV